MSETVDHRLHVVGGRLPQPVLQLALLLQLGQSSSIGLLISLGEPGNSFVLDELLRYCRMLLVHTINGLRKIEKSVKLIIE